MFETFGDKYNSYLMQVVKLDNKEYLMKRDGTVYERKKDLPQIEDTELISRVQEIAKKNGGWSV